MGLGGCQLRVAYTKPRQTQNKYWDQQVSGERGCGNLECSLIDAQFAQKARGFVCLLRCETPRFLALGRLARPRVWSCTNAQSYAIAQWLKGAAARTLRTQTKSVHEFYCSGGKGRLPGTKGSPRSLDPGTSYTCTGVLRSEYSFLHLY